MLVDSHCHLDRINLKPYDGNLSAAIQSALDRGIEEMLCISISLENRADVLAIAESHANVFASTGVHPLDVQSGLATQDQLLEWIDHPKVVAVGETGLDYYYDTETKQLQQESFAIHLQAAGKKNIPVVVHTRSARQDTLDLIREHGNLESAGVLHCFTEDWDMASKALDLNYYVSISGIVTFKNASELRDVVKKLPLDRLLVETDSPYLAPEPYRGKKNEPKYVREVAEYIADLKGVSFETLAEVTTNNYRKLFWKTVA
ncbi:TatD family hydrolase [Sessilibacter corallicola]|uniref:TatD family hydrolase n=1 Tax=Sessilibacter corallicola TaxID=2904075 RepID=A0ABQ0A991_9GAMM